MRSHPSYDYEDDRYTLTAGSETARVGLNRVQSPWECRVLNPGHSLPKPHVQGL